MTDLDFWISEADARYTDEVHPFWCLQQGVVFPRLCREARLWWVLKRCFSKARSTELQVWVFLICLSIFCPQPWKSAPSRTAWWGQTSTRQWNQACSTCLTGSVYTTQVRQVTNEIPLLWRVIPSFQRFFSLAGTIFEGEYVDVFTMVKHIDYPRDRETGNIIAAVHPRLQVRPGFHSIF